MQPQSSGGYQPVAVANPEKGAVLNQPPPQGATTVYVAAPNTQIVYQSAVPQMYDSYNHVIARKLGILNIICGILAILLQVAAVMVVASMFDLGTGIGNGIVFIIVGILGMKSATSKTCCMIASTLIMAIIALFDTCSLFVVALLGMAMDINCEYVEYYLDHDSNMDNLGELTAEELAQYSYCKDPKKITVNGAMVILAIVEFILLIITSVVCCRTVCCGTRRPQQQQGMVLQPPGAQGQPAYQPPGALPCQPAYQPPAGPPPYQGQNV